MGAIDPAHRDSIVALQPYWLAAAHRADLANDERKRQMWQRLAVEETGRENLHVARPDEAAFGPLEPAALAECNIGQERHFPAETLPRQERSVKSRRLENFDARFSDSPVPQALRPRFGGCFDPNKVEVQRLHLHGTVSAKQRPCMRCSAN